MKNSYSDKMVKTSSNKVGSVGLREYNLIYFCACCSAKKNSTAEPCGKCGQTITLQRMIKR